MQLGTSGTTDPSNLRGHSRYLVNAGTDFTETDIDALLNRWYHLFINEILDSLDDWDVQGDTATATLVADQREYTFPSDILKVKKIQLKLDGTNWIEPAWLDVAETNVDIADEDAISDNFTDAEPYVSVFDNSIFIWSNSVDDVTGGLKIWFQKEATELSSASDEPNIAEAYQKGLCYGVSMDYWDKFGNIQKAREMRARLYGGNVGDRQVTVMGVIPQMKAHYSQRVERNFIVKPSSEDYS